MCQPGTCCPGAFWSLVILCDFEAVASQGIVGICWNMLEYVGIVIEQGLVSGCTPPETSKLSTKLE